MDNYVYKKQIGEVRVVLEPDDDIECPRKAWDNFGVMACTHKRYDLGDRDGMDQLRADIGHHPLLAHSYDFNDDMDLVNKAMQSWGFIWLPLDIHDHGGISMYHYGRNDEWEYHHTGLIYATPAMMRKEWGIKRVTPKIRQKVEEILKSEVETYDQFLTGEVFGYTVSTGPDQEEVDSCWGFYGYEHAIEEANNALIHQAKQHHKLVVSNPKLFS